jgi:PAS domain-containing protein
MTSRVDTSLSHPETLSHHTFEQAPIGIVYADRDGKVLRANPAFCRLLGFDSGELETKSIEELTHQADVDCSRPSSPTCRLRFEPVRKVACSCTIRPPPNFLRSGPMTMSVSTGKGAIHS